MRKFKTVAVPVTKEMAEQIERANYIYRGRKQIINTILQNENGKYNTTILDYYQKKYDESFIELSRITQYVESDLLQEFKNTRYRWYVELSSDSIIVTLLDQPIEEDTNDK